MNSAVPLGGGESRLLVTGPIKSGEDEAKSRRQSLRGADDDLHDKQKSIENDTILTNSLPALTRVAIIIHENDWITLLYFLSPSQCISSVLVSKLPLPYMLRWPKRDTSLACGCSKPKSIWRVHVCACTYAADTAG